MIAKVQIWKKHKKTIKSKQWFFKINNYIAEELYFYDTRNIHRVVEYLINCRKRFFSGFSEIHIGGKIIKNV